MATLRISLPVAVVATSLTFALSGCAGSSSTKGTSEDASPTDATKTDAHGDAATLDAHTTPHLDASGDGARPSDANADAAPYPVPASPCPTAGDRGLTPEEPWPDTMLIQNGGRIYNVKTPPTSAQHAAVGDGVTDDTGALQDAWDYLKDAYVAAGANQAASYTAANFWVYLPHGDYLVSDTIIYRGATLETDPQDYVWNDVINVRFLGENRSTTRIRLADGSAGFGDVTMPKIVLALQHPDTVFNNIATDNVVRNLTIDTGRGNAGAVALLFQGANMTSMRDVTLLSEDGQGAYGLWFNAGSVQGYYKDLTIKGFAAGIYVSANGEMNPSLEHVSLLGQSGAGVSTIGGGLSLRDVCSDQRMSGGGGVQLAPSGEQVVVLDSTFLGSGSGAAITMAGTSEQSMFVRGVSESGYESAVRVADASVVSGPTVGEWVALPTVALFDGGVGHSLGLPINDTPALEWYDPATEWADVDTFGAKGDGTTDDTAAIQAAMSSGKPVVVFPKAAYKTSAAFTVPASVMRIDGLQANLGTTSFVVEEAASVPLAIEHVSGYGSVTLKALRPIILSERSGDFIDSQPAAVDVFLENCDNIGENAQFCPPQQTTWARSIDTEATSGNDFLVSGGTMWIFDYKTENKPCTSLRAENGATVEVFNGYVNSTESPGTTPMIVNDHSKMSFVGFTNLSGTQWTISLEEIRDAGTATLAPAALPVRSHGNIFIPLYSGNAE